MFLKHFSNANYSYSVDWIHRQDKLWYKLVFDKWNSHKTFTTRDSAMLWKLDYELINIVSFSNEKVYDISKYTNYNGFMIRQNSGAEAA